MFVVTANASESDSTQHHASTQECSTRRDDAVLPFSTLRKLVDRGPNKAVYAVTMQDFYEELHTSQHTETPFRNKREHHRNNIDTSEVAVKRFSSALRGAFEHERAILQHLLQLNNDRIIPLLASHEIRNDYFLLLPLAGCNLHEYWAQTNPTSDPESYTAWSVNETKGLMHALSMIHRTSRNLLKYSPSNSAETKATLVGIIHGDIKPRNILVFRSQNNAYPMLKWSDFGLSTWADTDPGFRTTRTYDAPENGVRSKIGTKSDVWSFGCVLLEFVIWLLHGNDAVHTFGAQRSMRTPGSGLPLKDDHFYTLVYANKQPVGATVRAAVSKCLENIRQDRRCVGDLGLIMRLVAEEMLVVDEHARSDSFRLAQTLGDPVK